MPALSSARWAFWCVAALIAAFQILSPGYDGQDHAHRIVALADQIRGGAPSLLLTDDAAGSVLPTFVYYSILPYLPPLLLNLAGLPAFVALKLVAAVALILMAGGLQAVIETLPEERRRQGYLIAILFLAANSVYGLWIMRTAFAEVWVHALVPWVVVAMLRGRRLLLLGLFLVQLCAHPIVFGHALGAALLLALALAPPEWRRLARNVVPVLIAALICSAPFWLPQAIWRDSILGTAGLPVHFADSFFDPGDLARPLEPQTLGIWLPIAVALMLVLGDRRRGWPLAVLFFASLAIQTKPLFAMADLIPLLSQSLFVWRLMLPSAFIAFVALLIGWPAASAAAWRVLQGLTALSLATMMIALWTVTPGSIDFWSSGAVDDDVARRQYVGTVHGWGVREFAPNYARLADGCDIAAADLQEVSVAELRRGIRPTAPYLSVRGAPVDTVTYLAGDMKLSQRACRDSLRLGPVPTGTEARMSESALTRLLVLRLVVIAALVGVLATAISGARLSFRA